jgi:hypothetical protein
MGVGFCVPRTTGLKVHLEGHGNQISSSVQTIVDRLAWSHEGKAATGGEGTAVAVHVDHRLQVPFSPFTIETAGESRPCVAPAQLK